MSKKFITFSLGAVFLFALLNPVFKKYDYGAGLPLLMVFAAIVVVVCLFQFNKKQEVALIEKGSLLVFLGALVLSFAFSQTRNWGLTEVLAYGSVIPLYLVLAYRKDFLSKDLFNVVGAGLFLSIMVGYFFYFTGPEVRMFGPFFNILYHANNWPNAFGLFLLLGWPVLILLFSKRFNKYAYLGFALVFSALLLTFSRGALIAFCGQLFLLGLYFFRRLNFKTISTIVVITTLSLGMFTFSHYVRSATHEVINIDERAKFENSESLTSTQERVDFWNGAIELTKEKPLLGWGPYSFRYAYNGIQKTFLGSSDHPHNIFLKISSENGLIALSGFLVFLGSVFLTVGRRFKKLSREKRDTVAVLSVAIAGAFAHNLIDYNFNFLVNLMLLFVYLAFIRSFVVGRSLKSESSLTPLFIAGAICLISIYEVFLLGMHYMVDEDYLKYSLYPRNYYLVEALDIHTSLNPLDGKAYYLQGVLNSDDSKFLEAIEKDPMNDLRYYVDYIGSFDGRVLNDSEKAIVDRAIFLTDLYFEYVNNNVHFTAYTQNVESCYELVDALMPYLDTSVNDNFLIKREVMMKKTNELRNAKSY